jgi:hypothetical protein
MWLLRLRDGYDTVALFNPLGRYGSVNPAGVVSFLVAAFIGLGLVTSTAAIFKGWVGYLLVWFPFLGGKSGAIGGSSIGLLIAFAIGGVLYAILGPGLGWVGHGAEAPRARAVSTPAAG